MFHERGISYYRCLWCVFFLFFCAIITVCVQDLKNAVTADTDGCMCAPNGSDTSAPTCNEGQLCDATNKRCCTYAFLFYALYQSLHATQLSDHFFFITAQLLTSLLVSDNFFLSSLVQVLSSSHGFIISCAYIVFASRLCSRNLDPGLVLITGRDTSQCIFINSWPRSLSCTYCVLKFFRIFQF